MQAVRQIALSFKYLAVLPMGFVMLLKLWLIAARTAIKIIMVPVKNLVKQRVIVFAIVIATMGHAIMQEHMDVLGVILTL